jgi:hypothetical protein
LKLAGSRWSREGSHSTTSMPLRMPRT